MKSRGILFKNIAAVCMLLALLSLLLPFCKVTTPDKSVNVSGFDILTISARMGYHYHQNGSIEDSYQIKGNLTFGDVKSEVQYVKEQQGVESAARAVAISLFPILLCGLAMIFAVLAASKVSMFLSTLFITGAFIENIVLIKGFQKVQKQIFMDLQITGIQLGLLIGFYVFTALCGFAVLILLFGWITSSFSQMEYEEEGDYDEDLEHNSGRKRKRKQHNRKKIKKKTKRKKSSGKKEKTDNHNTNENKLGILPAKGKITGRSGMYEDIGFDLSSMENNSIQLGTSRDGMPVNSSHREEGKYVAIRYNRADKSYKIISHSNANIVLQNADGKQHMLVNGKHQIIGAKTIMYVGNTENKIYFN